MSNNITSLFLGAWAVLPKIEVKESWSNGTGYLDHLTTDKELKLPVGTMVGTTMLNGAKAIIKTVGEDLYQVVFQRGPKDIFVSNEPHPRILPLLGGFHTNWSYETMEAFLGLREHGVILDPDYIQVFLGSNDITYTKELSEVVKAGLVLTEKELNSYGIDYKKGLFSMAVKKYI